MAWIGVVEPLINIYDEGYDGVEYWSNPERTGWLMKQGEYIKTWRRRWFVLKEGKLFWFKDSTVTCSSCPRGYISLAICSGVKNAAEDIVNNEKAFQLCTRFETMYYIADTEKEKEDWIHSIGKSVLDHSRYHPERTGWLMKQGDIIKTWRRRWFLLKQGKLFWFEDSTNGREFPRDWIPMEICITVKGAEDILNNEKAFELSTELQTRYFIADSVEEKEEWIHSIGRSLVKHSNSITDIEIVNYKRSRY